MAEGLAEGLRSVSRGPVSQCRRVCGRAGPARPAARALPASVIREPWGSEATGAHRAGQGRPPGVPRAHRPSLSRAEGLGELSRLRPHKQDSRQTSPRAEGLLERGAANEAAERGPRSVSSAAVAAREGDGGDCFF